MPEFDSSLEYRDIPGFKDYRVGTDGSLWSCRGKSFELKGEYPKWRRMSPATSKGKGKKRGYPHVNLYRDKVRHTGHAHLLVLTTFVGPAPEGMVCRHLDGDPLNNRLDNLAWGTAQENSDDKFAHGTVQLGESHHSAVLCKDDVIKARRMKRSGMTSRDIAAKIGKSQSSLKRAIRGVTWEWVQDEPPVRCDHRSRAIA